MQCRNVELRGQVRKDIRHLAGPDDERLTAPCKVRAQLCKAFRNEGPLAAGGIGQLPEVRLGNVERQDPSLRRRRAEGRVIRGAQVALEPDDVQRIFHAR